MSPPHSLYLPICHFPVRQSLRDSVWKPSPLGKRFDNASSDTVILSYAVQLDLEWIEFRWMHFKWFEFWQLQFMWFEFKQCSWKVVQIRAMWIQVRVVLPSDPQVGGHTSWLSGHCPLLRLTCNQATVPAKAFPPVLAAYVTSDGHLGRDRLWTVWRFPSEDFTKLIYHPLITRREIFSLNFYFGLCGFSWLEFYKLASLKAMLVSNLWAKKETDKISFGY